MKRPKPLSLNPIPTTRQNSCSSSSRLSLTIPNPASSSTSWAAISELRTQEEINSFYEGSKGGVPADVMDECQIQEQLSFLLSLFLTLAFSDDPDCVYTAYVRTGSIIKAGTDSTVNLRLYDSYGYGIEITNLEAWGGLIGPGYNYFERGNLDIFSGRGPCLRSSICALNLTSDGSGPNHSWYINYVEVASTGAHVPCNQQLFTIEQWLATDTSPYELTAVRNYCNSDIEGAEKRGRTEHRMIRSGSIGLVSTV